MLRFGPVSGHDFKSGRTRTKENWASAPAWSCPHVVCPRKILSCGRAKQGSLIYKEEAQGLKPSSVAFDTARLKPCPDTKHQSGGVASRISSEV
jgi:hypothetical protein